MLAALGIELASFQLAGGLVLLIIALRGTAGHPRTGGYEGASALAAPMPPDPPTIRARRPGGNFPCRPLLDRRDGALRFAAFHDEPVFEAVPWPLDTEHESLFRCSSSSTNTRVISVLKPSL